jgi:hypothetical protein
MCTVFTQMQIGKNNFHMHGNNSATCRAVPCIALLHLIDIGELLCLQRFVAL